MHRFLFALGLSFLVICLGLSILSLLVYALIPTTGKNPLVQPVRCVQCGSGGPNFPLYLISAGTVSPGLIIEYDWPKHMNINSSESISVALTVEIPSSSVNIPSPAPMGNVSDREKKSLSPVSLTTEEYGRCTGDARACQLSNLFGDGYTMSIASANIVATSFDIQLMGPVERSTDQPLIEWDWNISPKLVGSQVLTIGVNLQWTPTSKAGGAPIVRQFWQSSIIIDVQKPFLETGQLTLSAVISGVGGIVLTGISLPSILEQWQQKREKKKQKVKYCQKCGVENSQDFEYCSKCGKQRTPLPSTPVSVQTKPLSSRSTEKMHSSSGNATEI